MNDIEIKDSGICECIFEPRGDAGLEGFRLGGLFKYELCFNNRSGKLYMRVYSFPFYYETCGRIQFNKYFKRK